MGQDDQQPKGSHSIRLGDSVVLDKMTNYQEAVSGRAWIIGSDARWIDRGASRPNGFSDHRPVVGNETRNEEMPLHQGRLVLGRLEGPGLETGWELTGKAGSRGGKSGHACDLSWAWDRMTGIWSYFADWKTDIRYFATSANSYDQAACGLTTAGTGNTKEKNCAVCHEAEALFLGR